MILLFEGLDGSGKDTLRDAVDSATKFKHVCIVRAFLSNIVYARHFHRPEWTDPRLAAEQFALAHQFITAFKPLIVYTYAEPEVLRRRILSRGEDWHHEPPPEAISKCYEQLFHHMSLARSPRLLRLDASNTPVAELTERVMSKIKHLQEEQ